MTKTRQTFKGIVQNRVTQPDRQPAILGNGLGQVAVPGRDYFVYALIANNALIEVFNNRVPIKDKLPVWVGYDPVEPWRFQVLGIQGSSAVQQGIPSASVGWPPADHYRFGKPNADPLWVEKRQTLMANRVTPSGLGYRVYPDWVYLGDGSLVEIGGSTLHDLTSLVPTTAGKALWVLVTVSLTGVVTSTAGSEVNIEDLPTTALPTKPTDTLRTLAAIRLYTGQTAVQEAQTNSDIRDLRFSEAGGGMASLPDHTHSSASGDGSQFVLTNLLSTGAAEGQVPTANGSGGISWEDPSGGGGPASGPSLLLSWELASDISVGYSGDTWFGVGDILTFTTTRANVAVLIQVQAGFFFRPGGGAAGVSRVVIDGSEYHMYGANPDSSAAGTNANPFDGSGGLTIMVGTAGEHTIHLEAMYRNYGGMVYCRPVGVSSTEYLHLQVWQLAGSSGIRDYVCIKDKKSSGTPGGTATSGSFLTRDLNTIESDDGGHASLASNQVTLQAGTYEVRVTAPGYAVDRHQIRLRNITDSTTLLSGTPGFSYRSSNAQTLSLLVGKIVLETAKVLEVQHQVEYTNATYGFGVSAGFGEDEVYTTLELWKVL